jgi:hypothetical protein
MCDTERLAQHGISTNQQGGVEELLCILEEAQRVEKHQAGPFSRREPRVHPAKPGRKAGARYGR